MYYAIKKGLIVGITEDYNECLRRVKGFKGAQYKKFSTFIEASNYLEDIKTNAYSTKEDPNEIFVYCDGSYSSILKKFSYSSLIIINNTRYLLFGYDNDPTLLEYNNISGEIYGVIKACEYLKKFEFQKITFNVDYQGLIEWYSGNYKTTNVLTRYYKQYLTNYAKNKRVDIVFNKVVAHSNNEYNAIVDKYAKEALTINSTSLKDYLVNLSLDDTIETPLDLSFNIEENIDLFDSKKDLVLEQESKHVLPQIYDKQHSQVLKISDFEEVNVSKKDVLKTIEDIYNLDGEKIVFITGAAGTGKSTLVKNIEQYLIKKRVRVALCAPTGIAAINIGGVTIHSLFGLPFGILDENEIYIENLKYKSSHILSSLEVLIIDEISMVRVDCFSCMDKTLRLLKNNDTPFGGITVLMFGDLLQLPPVAQSKERDEDLKTNTLKNVKNAFMHKYGGIYFFNSSIFKNHFPFTIELTHIFRQNDPRYIELLNNIRENKATKEDYEILRKRTFESNDKLQNIIKLTSTNKVASFINNEQLKKINEKPFIFNSVIEGKFNTSSFPCEQCLVLKKGAMVMILINDIERRYVNGTIGFVCAMESTNISVNVDGFIFNIKPHTWENIEYRYSKNTKIFTKEVIGMFTQFPLRLAYAITIHKSQGQTFKEVVLDLTSPIFLEGQAYVALSRCKTINGLYIVNGVITKNDIMVDKDIINFLNLLKQSAKYLEYNDILD
ncbi:MAG: viroplasmin family protein [Acholeplasmatales bacterium]|jgi:viroplasmin and RNaseH domain-containing protein/energy-coupling factor transporter ATP-binding protein EcfA2|nr:viroplasmin family protein [Acholeplasmatales bacterium]